jgi:peptide/nickel transport system permease protein
MTFTHMARRTVASNSTRAGLTLMLVLLALMLLGPLGKETSGRGDLENSLSGPSRSHPMGADQLGRDVFARVSEGLRGSLMVGATAAAISGIAGGILGLASGFWRGWPDLLLQRLIDALMAVPLLVLALAVIAATGPTRTGVIIALSVAFTPLIVRVARSSALTLRESGYVEASWASGASTWHIVSRHLAPNAFGPWAVVVSTQVGGAVLAEASLSFLGAGPGGSASLGSLLGGEAQTYAFAAPWLIIWPGIVLAAVSIAAILIGDGLAQSVSPISTPTTKTGATDC